MKSSALKESTATNIEQVLNVQSVRELLKGTFLKRQSTENRASQPECHGVPRLCPIYSAIQGRSYLANCVLQSRGWLPFPSCVPGGARRGWLLLKLGREASRKECTATIKVTPWSKKKQSSQPFP